MSAVEGEVVAEGGPPPVEAEARKMGWFPREQWRGTPEHWVDAQTFVERGKQVMPILQANNRRLAGEREALQARVAAAEAKNREFAEQLDQLTKFQADVAKQQRERMRAELMRELAAAREAGNLQAEVAVQDRLAAVREPAPAAVREPAPAPRSSAGVAVAELPEMKAFREQHSWWDADSRTAQMMRGAAVSLVQEMAASGELASLTPAQRLAKVAEVVEAQFAAPPPVQARVEGGGRSAAAAAEEGKQFSDLPAEAREACLRQADWLVGEKKAFKSMDDWKKRYVQEYFG